MAKISFDKVQLIVKNNPAKSLISNAREISQKLQLNILGTGIDQALKRNDYFENADVFKVRNENATSNADLFARLLHREEMVFTAKGGACAYTGLSDVQTVKMDATLDTIRYNMTIRTWIKEFALQAYRVDPMAVLFIEVDANNNSYPTYKSTDCIYDYQTNGRKLEYICFRLTNSEAVQLLTNAKIDISNESDLKGDPDKYSMYYRFVDDAEDRIVKNSDGTIILIDSIPNVFKVVPAIIASNLIDFKNNQNFLSPISKTVELADTYLQDRSIRDLSKKYSGFPKGYEPLLKCEKCAGVGFLSGNACPDCTPAGADKGLGFKLRTKVADIARFPLPKEGQQGGIQDPSKFFGYIAPPIDVWNKQDTALNDIETAMNDTYWGTTSVQSTTGPTVGDKHSFKETATKTLSDLQPVYLRLNKTADWAETTENALCDFIGFQLFGATFKGSVRTYGRYYILETPDELMEQYLDMKTKGAPQTALFDVLSKYYHAMYANDQRQLAIKLKLMDVEPFIHQTAVQVQANNPSRIDFFTKIYFSEWLATKDDAFLLQKTKELLLADLTAYATTKMVLPADLLVPPTVSISETIRNAN
ncbi:MAG: hypothetical protein JWR05_3494 [Mucilaginibacter sp.]|nr:hypothetical protein [Mucilaginibacter sp.]